nr:MAG TPA: SMR Proline-rich submaxillary gland androgen-regulated family [Caudoviricetes sp.]
MVETIAIYIILGLWALMGTIILLLVMKRAIDEL